MASVINSFAISGVDGYVVKIETDTIYGKPCISIVGLGDASVKEAKERGITNLIVPKDNIVAIGDDLSSLEKVILKKIGDNSMTLGELLMFFQEDKAEVLETISIMELKGKTINVGGILRLASL